MDRYGDGSNSGLIRSRRIPTREELRRSLAKMSFTACVWATIGFSTKSKARSFSFSLWASDIAATFTGESAARASKRGSVMAKGIYERKGKNGDVTYYIRYQTDGVDIKERVGKKSRGFTRELAKEALNSRLGDIAQGHFNLEKVRKPVPFSKLVEKYKEFAGGYKRGWETEKYIVEEFASLLGDTPLAQITTWQIEKWKAETGKRLNPVTVNRRLTVIKHMFKKAVEWDLLKSNPATSVKRFAVTSERTRFLTEYEIHVLLEKCENQVTSPWLLPLVTLALNTGMRQGELLKLKWDNLDLERGAITIIQSKTLRRKTIAINERARQALNWLQANRYGELLFMWPWGAPIGKVTVYDAFKKVCSAAKIDDFPFFP